MSAFEITTSRTGEQRFQFERINILLGANGTGKSRLLQELKGQAATLLPEHTPVRIEGGRAVQMVDSLELNNRNFGEFQTFEKILSGFRQKRTETLTGRLFHGLKALEQMGTEEKIKHSDAIVEWEKNGGDGARPQFPIDPMGRVFEIFNDIFPSITLRYRQSDRRLLCKKDGNEYGPSKLSDGEKQVFSILVDVIELTDEKSVLFIDEPELNLNPGLANRLWSSIEGLLPHSVFIYATHSVSFAMREAVERLLILSNDSANIQEIEDLEALPFEDQRELLGNIPALISQSQALVVEGHDESFDAIFYRWLLQETTFAPSAVGGSEDVIAIVSRSGKWARISPEVSLMGVVDRDYKSDEEVEAIESKGLVVLNLHEAESYLCQPELLAALADKLGTMAAVPTQDDISAKLFEYVQKHKLAICARRANDRLRQNIRPSIPAKALKKIMSFADLERAFLSDVTEQLREAESTFNEKNVRDVLREEHDRIENLLTKQDVDEALRLLPAKELLDSMASWFKLADANSLARAARRHLQPSDFPLVAALQERLREKAA